MITFRQIYKAVAPNEPMAKFSAEHRAQITQSANRNPRDIVTMLSVMELEHRDWTDEEKQEIENALWGARDILANVPGQVSPLAFGMISCASRRHDKSAEGMGISCTGPLAIYFIITFRLDIRCHVKNRKQLSRAGLRSPPLQIINRS